jgi:hypothetical protein
MLFMAEFATSYQYLTNFSSLPVISPCAALPKSFNVALLNASLALSLTQ